MAEPRGSEVCPVCLKTVTVNQDRLLRLHGPRNNPCRGAFLPPVARRMVREDTLNKENTDDRAAL